MESSHIPYDDLIAYGAGESDFASSVSVKAHTTTCAQCNGTVVWFRTIRGLMRSDPTREPPAAVVARAQAIFSSRNAVAQPRWPRLSFPPLFQVARRFSAAVVLATILIVLVLFFGGVGTAAAATSGSLPGDTLYPVKIAFETLQLVITLDPVNKAELYLHFAQARVKEIEALDARGDDGNIPAAARSYADQVIEAGKLLASAKKENRPVAAVAQQMGQVVSQSNVVLTALLETLPAEAKPVIARAIEASTSAESNVPDLQPGTNPSPPARAKPTVTVVPNAAPAQPQEPKATSPGTTSSNPQNCGDSSLTVTVSPTVLWPADHKYVTVIATVNGGILNVKSPSVTSSEPDGGLGSGDLPTDMVIVDNRTFQLRAERSGNGPGRVYTITYTATDACGNAKLASATVTVPHDQPAPGGQNSPQGQPNSQPPQGQPNSPPGQNKSP